MFEKIIHLIDYVHASST